ncbi:hypothetical protein BH20CHL7_BH20CHL7_19650 [soil metagenome]
MIALTTLTLWSLGQAIVVTPDEATAAIQAVATNTPQTVMAARG